MRRVFILVLTCGAVAVLHVRAQPRVATFDEALAIMLESNDAVGSAQSGLRAAEQERRAAIGLRLPTVAVSGAYTWLGEDVAIDLNGVKRGVVKGAEGLLPALDPALGQALQGLLAPIAGANWELVLQQRSLASLGGTITIPIFTGGRINVANRAARIGQKMAESALQEVCNQLTSQLVERYFGVLMAYHAVEVRRRAVEGVGRHLADARALERNGVIASSERLYVEYKMAEAERDLQKALLEERTAREALGNTLGGVDVQPVTAMFVLENPEGVEFFVESALENNSLLHQAHLQEGLARENVRMQRAEFFPQIAAIGTASFYNWQVSDLLPRWAIGVGASFKIFNGLTREYKYSAAKHSLRSVESLVSKAESDIVLLVESAYDRMMSCLALLRSLDSSMAFAEEYLRSKRAAFRQGVASSSEVVDAELNLAKARVERLEAAYRFDIHLARLLEAAGLSEEFVDYIKRADAHTITF